MFTPDCSNLTNLTITIYSIHPKLYCLLSSTSTPFTTQVFTCFASNHQSNLWPSTKSKTLWFVIKSPWSIYRWLLWADVTVSWKCNTVDWTFLPQFLRLLNYWFDFINRCNSLFWTFWCNFIFFTFCKTCLILKLFLYVMN